MSKFSQIKNRSLHLQWDRETNVLKVFQMNKLRKVNGFNMKEIATFHNVTSGLTFKPSTTKEI
jgi:hypothetical protein